MTDNDIIKALGCCIAGGEDDCLLCPLYSKKHCTYEKDSYIADLINRQKAEIEGLQSVNADFHESLRLAAEANKDMQAEVERYKKYYEAMETELDSFRKDQAEVRFLKNRIRAEAIKEFAERLTERIFNCSLVDVYEHIDNLVNEMTEDPV